MKPETELFIYEIRSKEPQILSILGSEDPENFLGPDLIRALYGLHLEADFIFLFFNQKVQLEHFLARFPALELRQIHELRYDQWQDGAGSRPFSIGPLFIKPLFGLDHISKGNPLDSNGSNKSGAPGGGVGSGLPRPLGAPEPLVIDPGLAFGFGGHPTTKACLEFLLRLYRPGTLESVSPETALDLGCGTGILALAAARLGAKKVLGLDHSHLAVDSANKNAALNGLGTIVTIKRALAQDLALYQAQLVMANIPLFVLNDLVRLNAFCHREYLIISGLLPEEGQVFLDLLAQNTSFQILDAKRSDRWISYLLKCEKL
jgi:ribosomal protein L11 methyltransferase